MKKRTARTDLPADVWDRLASEAAAKDKTLAAHLRDLLVRRDARLYPDVSRNED